MNLALVALGGALGAPARYALDRLIQRRGRDFPWGTLAVNVLGCFALGILVGADVGGGAFALLGVGFCGALSTYSTFSYETYRLIERGSFLLAAENAAVTVGATMAAVGLGYAIGCWVA